MILEQRVTSNHIVIPVFYHVEPTHVRKQQSSFGDAMAKHREMMEAETDANKRSKWAQKMDRWNKALIEVSDLKGKDANGRLEPEFIEEIVKDVYHRLHVPLRSPLPVLFGMETSVKFVTSWLKDDASLHTTNILTILGMGGIGKTSLAKYVYGLHCREFHTSSYIGDISRRCDEKFSGLLDLQKQLCDNISSSSIQVHDVSVYTSKIENVVARKKVFLVLDDVDSLTQLDALLGSKGFHPGSKVIVTTKDAWLTESCALFKTNVKPKHAKHELKGLSETESQKLLCFHAFMSNNPNEGYEKVSRKFVKYCVGHPLALEVLGKSLHNRDVAYWEDRIKRLKKETGSPINNVLKTSFDALSENDKELFKHIACFFVGMDRDFTETILNACDIDTRSGITNLIDNCLLSIRWNNELMMHQLLQKMGRFIVHEESPDKPWKRSRLWSNVESFKVLKQKKLIGSYSKDHWVLGSLKILNLSSCQQLCNLGGFEYLPKLERLILTGCISLLEVCESIEQCFELIVIDMSYCSKLEKLPRSLGMLKKVKTLLLKGCNLGKPQRDSRDMDSTQKLKINNNGINTITSSSVVLEAIPSNLKFFTISLPRSLVSLSLVNNNLSTDSFPVDFSCLSVLEELYLDENPIVSLPICVRNLPRLEILSMQNCKFLTSVEHPPHTLKELILFSDYQPLLQKVFFVPEMSPLKFLIEWKMFATSSFEIEGMVKIQPLAGVDEKVITSLGWTMLDFHSESRVATSPRDRGYEESEVQMYYEFGIFSTIYEGEEMPNWIKVKVKGSSISFIISFTPKKLRGFNFCYVLLSRFRYEKLGFPNDKFLYLPMIIIRNKTKNQTWIYEHYIGRVKVVGNCVVLLSHWMFGVHEMDGGDNITITVRGNPFHVSKQVTNECGVSFVYEDEDEDEEEDVLGYYKSWNHIIGGDLTPFEVKTGEYTLSKRRLMLPYIELDTDDVRFNGNNFQFRALSRRRSDIRGHAYEPLSRS